MKIIIPIEMYSTTVTVVTTFEEFKKLHKHAHEESVCVTSEYGSHIYVYVSNKLGHETSAQYIQYMSHELNHASMCLLNYVGVNFGYANQETLCYLQDYLMGKVFKVLLAKGN